MSRIEAIKSIESARKSKVICYLTGDRPQFTTAIGEDVIPILYRHLELIGKRDNIDLFLYTRGGDMVVPIRIVKLIRNYCKKKFSILVPYRYHSAGTLISLGADEIVMTKLAELTPVDPTSSSHPFNPKTASPTNPNQQIPLPVSVEDVRSYLAFAKDVLKAQDKEVVELYSKMTNHPYQNVAHLHPLSLGNVYRVQKMIKIITKRLLDLHFTNAKGVKNPTITNIIKEITEDICVHNYPIYFDEAETLGLNVQQASSAHEKLIWGLYELYSEKMKLSSPLNALEELGTNDTIGGNCYGAYIESEGAEDVFNFTYEIKKIVQQFNLPPGVIPPNVPPVINLNIAKMQWEKLR